MATINERIRISLELVQSSFLNPMKEANEKMKKFNGQLKDTKNRMDASASSIKKTENNLDTLNKKLISQKEQYRRVSSEISSLSSHITAFKSRTQTATKAQKEQLATTNRELSLLKQKKTAISNSMSALKEGINNGKRSISTTKDNTVANMGFFDIMRLNGEQFSKLNGRQHLLNKRMAKGAFVVRNFLHGMRGFKMEMLGVMFFGMAMNRMFMGLTKTSMEWFGVWEILSMALGILFLPLAEKMLKWSIKFLKWVGKLTKEEKKFWNQLVLVGIVLGTLLMLFGTLVLGLGAIAIAFSFLFSPIGLVVTALAALGGFHFLSKMFGDMSTAVADTEQKLISFGVSGEILDKIKEKVLGLKDSLMEMSQDWILVGTQIATDIVSGIGEFMKANPMMVVGAIAGVFLGGPAGAAIGAAIGMMFKNLKLEDITEILDTGLGFLDELIKGVMNNLDKLSEVVAEIAEKLLTFVLTHIGDFIKIGFEIGKGIGKGILSAITGFGQRIADKIRSRQGGGSSSGSSGSGSSNNNSSNSNHHGITSPSFNDFIWRPGKGAISINPNDTLVGFKGAPPTLGNGVGTNETNITNNFYGFTMSELERELDSRDRDMVAQMERNR